MPTKAPKSQGKYETVSTRVTTKEKRELEFLATARGTTPYGLLREKAEELLAEAKVLREKLESVA